MNDNFKDILRVEGVNFKGFGIIPKLIMFDKALSLEAKSIYAYFASYAGNGTTSFPGRSIILKQLKMSKDAYYRHYNQLISQGYIKIQQNKSKDGSFTNNIYTLVSNPPNVEMVKSKFNINKEIIKFTGIKSLGYGMIPKSVMIDQRLSVKAKGIYAYFASHTGSGVSSFPKVQNIIFHLNITENTYYTHYKQLINLNYITRDQRHLGGRLSVNDYFLVDNPQELIIEEGLFLDKIQTPKKQDTDEVVENTHSLPHPENEDTVDKAEDANGIQTPKIQDTVKQDMEKQYTVKQDTNSNSININNHNKIIPSFKDEKEGKNDIEKTFEEIEKDLAENGIPYYYCKDKKLVEKTIKHITQYDHLKLNYRSQPQEEIYEMSLRCLIDMVTTKDYTTYKGSKLNYSKVLDMVNELINPENIFSLTYIFESFVEKYIEISGEYEIKSYEKHMKSCLIQHLKDYKIEFALNLNKILKNI